MISRTRKKNPIRASGTEKLTKGNQFGWLATLQHSEDRGEIHPAGWLMHRAVSPMQGDNRAARSRCRGSTQAPDGRVQPQYLAAPPGQRGACRPAEPSLWPCATAAAQIAGTSTGPDLACTIPCSAEPPYTNAQVGAARPPPHPAPHHEWPSTTTQRDDGR
jgi:hypothetical protein